MTYSLLVGGCALSKICSFVYILYNNEIARVVMEMETWKKT